MVHSLNEVQPVSTSVDKEINSQKASTEAGYSVSQKGLSIKTENQSYTLRIIAKSDNTSNEPIKFQDAIQTTVIASIPVSSSSVSISSPLSPFQPTSPHPSPHLPSPTPLPGCSSCSSCLLRQLPSPLQGRFTPLLQDIGLGEVEEELGWVPPGDNYI